MDVSALHDSGSDEDETGLIQASPGEIAHEISLTQLVFASVNRDVEKSKAGEEFKGKWRKYFAEWQDYADAHLGYFRGYLLRLRDEVYNRVRAYRDGAETYQRALAKIGEKITPIVQPKANTEALPELGPTQKKMDKELPWGYIIAVPIAILGFKWLWNQAGQKKPEKVVITND